MLDASIYLFIGSIDYWWELCGETYSADAGIWMHLDGTKSALPKVSKHLRVVLSPKVASLFQVFINHLYVLKLIPLLVSI